MAWPAPSHYLNQCWNIDNWTIGNKLKWNLDQNLYMFNEENAIEIVVRKWVPFCLSLKVSSICYEFTDWPGLIGTPGWPQIHVCGWYVSSLSPKRGASLGYTWLLIRLVLHNFRKLIVTRQNSTQNVGNMPPLPPRHLLPHILQIMPGNLKYDRCLWKGHHNEENPCESMTKMAGTPKFDPFH